MNDPYISGPFLSPIALTGAKRTGNKQYDNEPLNGAAAALGGSFAAEALADDASSRHRALRALRMGGSFLATASRGAADVPWYYKGDYWFTPPMGLALLELHRVTGEKIWLDEAKRYASNLAKTQLESGTWTWVEESDASIGKSNNRKDRSWDNVPLHCADFLYFLGRLRVEHGVTDFSAVEDRAAAWMLTNTLQRPMHLERDYLWLDRRPGETSEANGPTWYLLYQAKYAKEFSPEAVTECTDWLKKHHLSSGVLTKDHYPRATAGFYAASAARYAHALAALATHRKIGKFRKLAAAQIKALRRLQDPVSGLIWGAKVSHDWNTYAVEEAHFGYFKAETGWHLRAAINALGD